MNVYTVSEARHNLSSLLVHAEQDGEVLLKRKDGRHFIIRPEPQQLSPLDVQGLSVNISADDIVAVVRSGRER